MFGISFYLLHQETTFLEACIENHTKANLFMDQVDFEPAKQWSAVRLQNEDSTEDPPTRSVRFSQNRYVHHKPLTLSNRPNLLFHLCVSVVLVD